MLVPNELASHKIKNEYVFFTLCKKIYPSDLLGMLIFFSDSIRTKDEFLFVPLYEKIFIWGQGPEEELLHPAYALMNVLLKTYT